MLFISVKGRCFFLYIHDKAEIIMIMLWKQLSIETYREMKRDRASLERSSFLGCTPQGDGAND